MAVTFGRTVSGFSVRGAGTVKEQKWAVEFGGDLKHTALFQTRNRPQRGDELECSLWDENRVITRVDAVTNLSGGVWSWEARIVPKSDAQSRAGVPFGITVSGPGARVNVGSVDQSVQTFNTSSIDGSAVLSVLNEIAEALKNANCSDAERQDALVDVEQAKLELRRSQPEPSRIWASIQRLNNIGTLAGHVAKIGSLLGQIIP